MSPATYAEVARRAVRVTEPQAPDGVWVIHYRLPYEVTERIAHAYTEGGARRRARILRAGYAAMLAAADEPEA